MPDTADRILRDNKRYTGDGLPNEPLNAPLPVGDPRSGRNVAPLAEWRSVYRLSEESAAAAQTAQAQAEAARDLAQSYTSDAVSQGNVPIYGSAAAVAGLEIPVGITAIRTNGFAAAGDGGAALYIYTGTTGPVAPGGIADDSATTRYFKLRCDRVNPMFFGAKGDGVTDDHDAMQAAFNFATAAGLPIYIPAGTYLIDSATDSINALLIEGDKNIKVISEGTIVAGLGILDTIISGSGRIIRVEPVGTVENTVQKFEWYGGVIDGSAMPNISPGMGSLVVGPKADITIHGVTFDNGEHESVGQELGGSGGDTGFFAKEYERCSISSCTFIGFDADAGIYLSGDPGIPSRRAVGAYIVGNRFRKCNFGVHLKRFAAYTVIHGNYSEECGTGFAVGATEPGDDQGTRVFVTNNTILKMRGAPVALSNADHCVVSGNVIIDWRRWPSDGTTETEVASLNRAGGIKLDGVRFCAVVGNVIGYDEWQPIQTSGKQSYGVSVQGYDQVDLTTRRSEYVMVQGNVFHGLYGGVLLDGNTRFCQVGDNVYTGILSPTVVNSGESNAVVGEGAFTPSLAGSGGNLNGANYSVRLGYEVISGKHVRVDVSIFVTALSGLVGTVTIDGLTHTAGGPMNVLPVTLDWNGLVNSAGYSGFTAHIEDGGNQIGLFEVAPTGAKKALTPANFLVTSRIVAQATYRIA